MKNSREQPLIVIVGPTASGKTAAAIQLAKDFDGEIICADSRTIYRGMDIGTAKPSATEQASVPHWGIDIVDPDERFTVADFKQYAEQKIAEIRARNKVPFLVGGTGLYVDSLLYGYDFSGDGGRMPGMRNDAIVVGIATKKNILRERIEQRTEQILQHGVVDEAIKLGKKYPHDLGSLSGIVYRSVWKQLQNTQLVDKKTTFEDMIRGDIQLAKRQMTWFRRHSEILWVTQEDVHDVVAGRLRELNNS